MGIATGIQQRTRTVRFTFSAFSRSVDRFAHADINHKFGILAENLDHVCDGWKDAYSRFVNTPKGRASDYLGQDKPERKDEKGRFEEVPYVRLNLPLTLLKPLLFSSARVPG